MNHSGVQDTRARNITLSSRDLDDVRRLLRLLAEHFVEERAPGTKAAISPVKNAERNVLLEKARSEVNARRRRAAIFSPSMFGEPAWDMLLALYLWESDRAPMAVTRLGEVAGAAPTTALRWLDYLESQELVRRESHPHDSRSSLVRLTDKAREALDLYYFETLKQSS